jgi:hypothetical protein
VGLVVAVGLVLAVVGTAGTGLAAPQEAEACRRVDLINRLTDDFIFGVEDIVIDTRNGIAIVSAHDRWALEDAMAAESERLPQGGLYGLAVDWTGAPPERVLVDDLSAAFKSDRDFRPQGLALLDQGTGRRLFVVNQRYIRDERDGGAWRRSPTIEVFDLTGGALDLRRTLEHPLICNPNAVAALGPDTLLVTNDRGACGGLGAWLEDVLPLDRANLVRLAFADDPVQEPQARRVAMGLRFANGVAVAQTGGDTDGDWVYVADTRKDEIAVFSAADLQSETDGPPAAILSLPDGPDNLRWAPDGRLISAVHPSLLRLALYIKRWLGVTSAPSRVLAISPDDGTSQVLFDDPEGELISAATAAAVHAGWLLIGSAFDRGLVVCRLPGAAETVQPEAQPEAQLEAVP